jgi:hypothetical protein
LSYINDETPYSDNRMNSSTGKPELGHDSSNGARHSAQCGGSQETVESGLTEIEVGRFPVKLCTDSGRAINQQEKGWETTLTGPPKELYTYWKTHLQPRGYKLRAQIATWPGGVPGEIGLSLAWD